MQAASLLLATTADNTANLATPGYRAEQVDLATSATGGVTAGVSRAPEEGVDLVEQVANLITGSLLYTANARMLRAGAETERSLLDLLA
jgi:flagellar hook-associated protein FlgK